MIINFRKGFEFLFKSFDIWWDTKLLQRLEKDWERFVLVNKRHWIFWILSSLSLILKVIIVLVNSYLLTFPWEKFSNIWFIISIFLLINVGYWLAIIVIYLIKFYKINWSESHIEDIYSAIKQSEKSDEAFTNFFNQTIFLLVSLIIIIVFSSITVISSFSFWNLSVWYWIANVFLFIVQLFLFYSYLKKMINLEMDFKIVVPGQIFFFNQNWLLWSSQTMNANKIKTMNTKYSGFLGSFFNYWDIVILTEWDQWWKWEMTMDYTWNPTRTVKEIKKVLDRDLETIERDVNILLKKFESEIWVSDVSSPENKEKLRSFVAKNDDFLKRQYELWDEETKREIKELYVILSHK